MAEHDPLCPISHPSAEHVTYRAKGDRCGWCLSAEEIRVDERARLLHEVTTKFTRYDTRDIGDAYHAQSIDELLAEGVFHA